MAHYRVYCLDGANKVASAEWIDAADDSAALSEVKRRFARHKCEVWEGSRQVGTVDTRRRA